MAVDTTDLLRTLRVKVGAEEDSQRRHLWFKIRVDGVVVRTTMISHGRASQIGHPLLGKIARQLGISTRQLEQLVECSLSAETYFELIREPRNS